MRAPWAEHAHAPAITQAKPKPGRREALEAALQRATGPVDPPKRFGRRENARASGQAASSPDSVGRPRGETRGSERRKHTRCGYTQFVRVAEVNRTHRASCPPGGRKSSWRTQDRALAGRKLEAPPDAGHGWREGEPVRGTKQTIKSTRGFGLWVSARRFSR